MVNLTVEFGHFAIKRERNGPHGAAPSLAASAALAAAPSTESVSERLVRRHLVAPEQKTICQAKRKASDLFCNQALLCPSYSPKWSDW